MSAPVIVLAPDSFKGSLDAPAVCAALARGTAPGVARRATCARCPMADGGEGTLDAVLAASGSDGTRASLTVRGAGGVPVRRRLRRRSARTATAVHRGRAGRRHHRSGGDARSPSRERDTRGVGELVRALLDRRRAALHDRAGRQQHQRRRRRHARGARDCASLDAAGQPVAPTPAGLARARARRRRRPRPAACRERRSRSCRTSTTRSAASAARRRSSARRRASPRTQSPRSTRRLARFAALAEAATGVARGVAAGRGRRRRPGLRAAARRRASSAPAPTWSRI